MEPSLTSNRSILKILNIFKKSSFLFNMLIVFVYAIIWAMYALFTKASQIDHVYPYNVMTITLTVEFMKLILGLVYFSYFEARANKQENKNSFEILIKDWNYGKYLSIPAIIYVVYNLLSFLNLRLVEPATYRVLINSRILFSGLLMQTYLKQKLTKKQWYALVLLLFGCTIEQLGSFNMNGGIFAIFSIALQGFLSSAAGVYFQLLLQDPKSQSITLWQKNIYLYIWGVIVNFIAILFTDYELLIPSNFFGNFDRNVIPIVICSSFGGFAASVLLKYMDVIAKEYANFLEMLLIAILAQFLFDTKIKFTLIIAVIIVAVSVKLYNTPNTNEIPKNNNIEFTAIPEEDDEDLLEDDI